MRSNKEPFSRTSAKNRQKVQITTIPHRQYSGCPNGEPTLRRAHFRFAIYLCMVLLHDFWIFTYHKQTADWEATDTLSFGNTRFLQNRQTTAASADKDKLGSMDFGAMLLAVAHLLIPTNHRHCGSYFLQCIDNIHPHHLPPNWQPTYGSAHQKLTSVPASLRVAAMGSVLVSFHNQRHPFF